MSTILHKLGLQKQIGLFVLALGLISISGILILRYSTPFGLAINDDSVAYIAGAQSILDGQGYREAWLISNGPQIHFPPGFPVALVLIDILLDLDPVRGARALNGLTFGLNIALTGWLAWRMTSSRLAGIIAASLVLLNSSILYIHTRAMSEPLYICLTLVSFLLLDLYFRRSQKYFLILLGIILGWSFLTRYAALALLATIVTSMLILHKGWRERIRSISLIMISCLPWIFAWSIRNQLVGDTITNRLLSWHPITQENWMLGVDTLSEFIIPINSWRKAIPESGVIASILLIGLAITIWIVYKCILSFYKPIQFSKPNTLSTTNSIYILIYMLALVSTMTLFDPATKFQVRIISPIYISIILLATALAFWVWSKKIILWQSIIVFLTVFVLGMFSFGQIKSIPKIQNSLGFANPVWQNARAITALKEFSPDTLILTNEPGLVYLHTGRPTGVLPRPWVDLTEIKQAVLDGEIVIALFRVNTASEDIFAFYFDLSYGLYRRDFSRSWILSAFPEQEDK